MPPLEHPILRFFRQVRYSNRVYGRTACMEWQAATNDRGYGVFSYEAGKTTKAHIWLFELVNGPIPLVPGGTRRLDLDHLCVNPPCVNPLHLEIVSSSVNIRRAKERRHAERDTDPSSLCPQGHRWDAGNLKVTRKGSRSCRQCAVERAEATRKQKRMEEKSVIKGCTDLYSWSLGRRATNRHLA